MKPPPFEYHAPTSTVEALEVLASVGEGGKVLAGGQSLIPLLNMRLAAPAHLVDIGGIPELDHVTVTTDAVVVGAGATQATVEHDASAVRACPLLGQALRLVAHPVIRNRGTVCGSIAHADPSGELTAVLAVLDGTVQVASRNTRRGEAFASADGLGGAQAPTPNDDTRCREVGAADFFLGPLESSLVPGDLVESVEFPRLPPRSGSAFVEVARRHGDYAVCGVTATVTLDDGGRFAGARAAFVSCGPVPVVVDLVETLGGSALEDAALEAAAAVARSSVEPDSDIHAGADYRRHLAGVLTVRALRQAAELARA